MLFKRVFLVTQRDEGVTLRMRKDSQAPSQITRDTLYAVVQFRFNRDPDDSGIDRLPYLVLSRRSQLRVVHEERLSTRTSD